MDRQGKDDSETNNILYWDSLEIMKIINDLI